MKQPFPLVSIVLPTFNRETYIIETIESVRSQSFHNWELLVIDDRSEDNTAMLISKIADDRIKIHSTTTRLGIAESRNEGMRKAIGKYIAFIDSDDLWATDKLEKQLAAFEKYPKAGFCLSNGYNFKVAGQALEYFYKERAGIKFGDIFLAFFKSEAAATMSSLMMRTTCLVTTGFFKEKTSMDFFLRLAYHFKAIILFEPLFYRRLHDSNYSQLNREKRHDDGIEMIRSYKSSLPGRVYKNALFRAHINFGENCLQYRQRKKAFGAFFKAWGYNPISIIPIKKIGKALLYRSKK